MLKDALLKVKILDGTELDKLNSKILLIILWEVQDDTKV